MKNLLLTTAILTATATAAFADGHSTSTFRMEADALEIYGSEFIGARIYVSETEVGENATGADAEWDDIGEVNNIILSRDGKVEAVLVDIGGFIGIGERQVALNMDAITFVNDDADDANDYFLVVNSNLAELEEAPEYTTADMMDDMEADMEDEDTAMARTAPDNMVDVDDMATLTSENLTGAAVYDANDAWVGEVSVLLLDDSGKISKAIVDVGGFIGIGEKPVALDMSELMIKRTDGGDDFAVYVSSTEAELEAMPTYEE